MTTARHTKGLALAGLTALLGSTVLAVVAPTAQAATGTTSYTCITPIGDVAVPVTVKLPASAPAGARSLPVGVDFTVPASLTDTLAAFGVTALGGSSEDFAIGFGNANVALKNVKAAPVPIVAGQDLVLATKGNSGTFTTPAPGTYALSMPAAFTMVPTNQDGAELPTLTCAITDPTAAQFGSVATVKQTSKVTAKAKKATIKKSEKATVTVVVKRQSKDNATGKVTAKDGKKAVGAGTLKNGKLVLTLKKMTPGKHTVIVTYAGDKVTKASQTKVVIKVTKK